MQLDLTSHVERRKQVRLKVRADLVITPQKYEGKTHYVVKDPVSLRYYRFNDQEYFVVKMFDGKHTMEEAQKKFEAAYRPQRLTHEDLEAFARQLLTAGLVSHESSRAAEELLESRRKQRRMQRIATLTNILYIKIPVIDPDRLLTWMYRYLWWIFTWPFFAATVGLMLAALGLVATHYSTFYDKLPEYQQFFRFQTVLYMWISLGIVKIIHEFGHGLSCKAYGGECHEMGFLFMCFSPAMYCNVSDSWKVANKWKRIIISFAGIYVELIIASISTFVWWYTPGEPFVNNIALCLMTLCSISTFLFNANPLMRFDGYYILADWLEIPNLRDRSNRYLKNLMSEYCLGIEVQPEPYMALNRKILFVTYAVVSYIYRWVITFSIIYTLSNFLKPYGLGTLSMLLAVAAIGSMVGWPLYRLVKGIHQRGRLPDMKSSRVTATSIVVFFLILGFFLLPLPISRVRDKGLVKLDERSAVQLFVPYPEGAILEQILVEDGERVEKGRKLAVFRNYNLERLRDSSRQEKIEHERQTAYWKGLAQKSNEPGSVAQYQRQADLSQARAEAAERLEASYDQLVEKLIIRSPIDGQVFSPPRKDEIGRFWEDVQGRPICMVGDPRRLKVLVPVAPYDYDLLKSEMVGDNGRKTLEASIRIKGSGFDSAVGQITDLPSADAKSVPVQLTFQGGGSLATKPMDASGLLVPQNQVYLIEVEMVSPDGRVMPGMQPTVKIHCRWRSAAWWTWRAINRAFDLRL